MGFAATLVTLLVALLHVGFFALESVLWTRPVGRRIFGQSAEEAETTRVLASNQGVYNLGLAVGLVGAAFFGEVVLQRFLLGYIVAVGLYGGATAAGSILFLQALPAGIALALSLAA